MKKKYQKHRMSSYPEYQVYQTAKDRCTNPNSQRWYTHGGRGIKFLFKSFLHFYETLGPRPEGDYSLERINNNGNYEPGNVKWATRSEQQKNKNQFIQTKLHGKGYYWHKGAKKWCARIKFKGITEYLGLFINKNDARQVYLNRWNELKGTK